MEIKSVEELMKKMKEVEKSSKLDLSSQEDLSIAIMNLVGLEEHFYFTAMKTNKKVYLDMLNTVREMRKELLGEIVKNPEGEMWCISKHLLACSMRLMEVGTKKLGKGEKKEAEKLFKKAFDLYTLFWSLNLKLVDTKEVISAKDKESSWMGKLSTSVKNMIDCCKE